MDEGEQRDLDFGRAGVAFVSGVVLHDLGFEFLIHSDPLSEALWLHKIAANPVRRRRCGRLSKRFAKHKK